MHRTTLTAIVALAGAILLAPAALAERPDDRAGPIGVGSVASTGQDAVRPDDRGGMLGVGSITVPSGGTATATRLDDRAGIRGAGPARVAPTILVADEGGFDWADAGIGAVGGLGLALLAVGLFAGATHRHRVHGMA